MKNRALLMAAVAGMLGAAGMANPGVVQAGSKSKAEMGDHKCGGKGKCASANKAGNINCYGVNKCAGTGKCGASCAGTNKCKGMGWLPMPEDSCLALENGSLEPVQK